MSRPRKGRDRRRQAPSGPAEDITIEKLAAQGDGEGQLADGTRAFVPLTLPGDKVRVKRGAKRGEGLAATVEEFLERAPRAAPFCPVFGRCGGCQLQHMPAHDYAAWKRDAVRQGLARQGIDIVPEPLAQVPADSRRRATLAAVRTQSGIVLGFNEAYGPKVIDIDTCPLLVAPLQTLTGPLRTLLGDILGPAERADIALTSVAPDAVDVLISTAGDLDLARRERLAGFAEENDIARISWKNGDLPPEPVAQRRDILLRLGPAAVPLPIECFLQPSAEGEAILQELVTSGVGAAKRVSDLYSGVGTFTLPLAAQGAHVWAFDGIAAQADALGTAAGRADLGGRVHSQTRDLKASPLTVPELTEFDAVVFDPPRAGAKQQAETLADSTVATVVAVSCNPATLGRDLRILIDGGYTLQHVTPVDQFPMSHHVEAVAILVR